ncbi:hypothetical protein JCM3774_000894 [Rhodotorula dairenensis]
MSIPDALHAPTGPATAATTATAATAAAADSSSIQAEVHRLTQLKLGIQAQLDVYFDVLRSNGCNMETPLVDPEGYPRADIDVAGVRTARVHIIRLRNDLKALLQDMELVVVHALPRQDNDDDKVEPESLRPGASGLGMAAAAGGDDDPARPFARVDAVAPNSPANQAGLVREDLVVSLGSVSSTNHDNLRAVAALVARSEGVALSLAVLRNGTRTELVLTPRSGWGGRGLLGCHIVPV